MDTRGCGQCPRANQAGAKCTLGVTVRPKALPAAAAQPSTAFSAPGRAARLVEKTKVAVSSASPLPLRRQVYLVWHGTKE